MEIEAKFRKHVVCCSLKLVELESTNYSNLFFKVLPFLQGLVIYLFFFLFQIFSFTIMPFLAKIMTVELGEVG